MRLLCIISRQRALAAAIIVTTLAACGETNTDRVAPGQRDPSQTSIDSRCPVDDPDKARSDPSCLGFTAKSNQSTIIQTESNEINALPGGATALQLTLTTPKDSQILEIEFTEAFESGSGLIPLYVEPAYGTAIFCVYVPQNVLPGTYDVRFVAIGTQNGTLQRFNGLGQAADIRLAVGKGSQQNQLGDVCSNTSDTSKYVAPD
jgi:hypothetical protein